MIYIGMAVIAISMAAWAAEVKPTVVRYFRKNPWYPRTRPRVNVRVKVRRDGDWK